MNVIIFIIYTIFFMVSGYIISQEFIIYRNIDIAFATIIMMIFAALIHENITRRITEIKLARHLLALKKAYDITKKQLSEKNNSQQITSKPFGSLYPTSTDNHSHKITAKKQKPLMAFMDAAPISNPTQSEKNMVARTPPFHRPPPPPKGIAPDLSKTEVSQLSNEVKILHDLVEQLYANSDPEDGNETIAKSSEFNAENNILRSTNYKMGDKEESLILDFVHDRLRKENIELYLQPIVSLPQRKRKFFECYNHIKTDDGTVISQAQYMQIDIDSKILSAIDNIQLFRCMQILKKIQNDDFSLVFFCTITLHSLLDKEIFYKFIQYLQVNSALAPNIILELSQNDYLENRVALTTPLKMLAKVGYRFSLEYIDNFNIDGIELLQRKFSHVKVDADVIINHIRQGNSHLFRSFKQRMDNVNIDIIVNNIDSEQILLELLDCNIDYGQGFLFGEAKTGTEAIENLQI